MEPGTPLWQEVVAEQGLEAVWPMDSEDNARQLQPAWARLADDVAEGGSQVGKAAGVVESSWPDPAGNTAVDAVTAYFDRIKETALQMRRVGLYGLTYGDHIEGAKNAVRDTIAGWEQAYAAAGVPRFGKDTAYEQSLVVYHAAQKCFKIIDDAVRSLQNTLVQQATEEKNQADRGKLDAIRQIGNVARLLDDSDRMARLNRWGMLTPVTAVKTLDDIDNGEPADQAVASNWLGWGANIGTSTALAAAAAAVGMTGASGAAVGMLGGMTVGAFTSGFVDSLYENGPMHLGTAMARGGEQVVDTYQGIGSALGDAGEWVGDRLPGQEN